MALVTMVAFLLVYCFTFIFEQVCKCVHVFEVDENHGIVCGFCVDKIPYIESGEYMAYNNEKEKTSGDSWIGHQENTRKIQNGERSGLTGGIGRKERKEQNK